MITEAAQADQIVRNGEADLVLIRPAIVARSLFSAALCSALHQDQKWPDQYLRAKS
jgi:hypothetical protein